MSVTYDELDVIMRKVLKWPLLPVLVMTGISAGVFQTIGYTVIALILITSAALLAGMAATCLCMLEATRKARLKRAQ